MSADRVMRNVKYIDMQCHGSSYNTNVWKYSFPGGDTERNALKVGDSYHCIHTRGYRIKCGKPSS